MPPLRLLLLLLLLVLIPADTVSVTEAGGSLGSPMGVGPTSGRELGNGRVDDGGIAIPRFRSHELVPPRRA